MGSAAVNLPNALVLLRVVQAMESTKDRYKILFAVEALLLSAFTVPVTMSWVNSGKYGKCSSMAARVVCGAKDEGCNAASICSGRVGNVRALPKCKATRYWMRSFVCACRSSTIESPLPASVLLNWAAIARLALGLLSIKGSVKSGSVVADSSEGTFDTEALFGRKGLTIFSRLVKNTVGPKFFM